MNSKNLVLIISVLLAIGLLTGLSLHLSNNKIIAAENSRKNVNAFESIVYLTKNHHPVFNESLKGKTIIINVWAMWCAPCRKEIPELNKLVKEFASDKIVFLALDSRDSALELPKMNRENVQFDYPKLFSQEVLIEAITSFAFDGERNSIPLNVVINAEGKFQFFYAGKHPEKLAQIREYLATVAKK